jgi:hypothetical protein
MPRFIYHSPGVIMTGIKREIQEELKGAEKYMDLIDQLAPFDLPREFSESIFKMAQDEQRHAGKLQKILDYMMYGDY